MMPMHSLERVFFWVRGWATEILCGLLLLILGAQSLLTFSDVEGIIAEVQEQQKWAELEQAELQRRGAHCFPESLQLTLNYLESIEISPDPRWAMDRICWHVGLRDEDRQHVFTYQVIKHSQKIGFVKGKISTETCEILHAEYTATNF
ncbi:hypothetical protein [Ruegeria sp.]|uniref:hypothetical protein n=1 Tax=Ruegeria sp. TaxID=1879320 RepID=UPI003C7E4742